jgi:hypothetical protein
LPAHGVELIHEHDRRSALLGFLEETPDPGSADTHKHLDEFRGRDAEEGNLGLTRHRSRQ